MMQSEATLLRASVAAGGQHSVFIDGEGRLFSSGNEATEISSDEEEELDPAAGLLGHGEGVTRLTSPTALPSLLGGEHAESVSAGIHHSLAIAADGSVWSWGCGIRSGHGDKEDVLQPKKIEAFAGQRVVAVSAGGNHSLAATADGPVWSWGHGTFGKLGHGDEQHQLLPKKTEGLAGQRVVDVSAGLCHSLALTAEGDVWSWGVGWNGVLGHGDEQRHPLPKKMEAFAGQRVVAVSTRNHTSLAVTADGAVWSWGNKHPPEKVEGLAGQHVVAASAGNHHSLAVTADGTVWSWGDGMCSGHGDQKDLQRPQKIEAFAGQRVVAVSAGFEHSLAATADGAVWSWGPGRDGCLGHGDGQSEELLPKKIEMWMQRPTPKKQKRAASPQTVPSGAS